MLESLKIKERCMEDFGLPREDKMNNYFQSLEEKLKNINFEKEADNWLEGFSDINSELWDYVHANNLQNEWVKDKPDLFERVVSGLKLAMDLLNMCHLLSGFDGCLVDVKIIEILQMISENEAFPLYAANLDKEESKQKTIARLIEDLFDGARYLNYIEELDDMNKKLKLNTGE